tara:strand:- start:80 stop:1270 length:1191 start_codon:yes stop_codon:yes gene_type:complete
MLHEPAQRCGEEKRVSKIVYTASDERPFLSSNAEDIFARWLKYEVFWKAGFQVVILPPKRLVDMLVRHPTWMEGSYVAYQLKTDGARHRDGTYKGFGSGGHRASFSKCDGYDHAKFIQILCGKMRWVVNARVTSHTRVRGGRSSPSSDPNLQAAGDAVSLWQVAGDRCRSGTVHVNRRNFLCIASRGGGCRGYVTGISSPSDVLATSRRIYNSGKTWSLEEALVTVAGSQEGTQHTQARLIDAFARTTPLTYPGGNTTSYDCREAVPPYHRLLVRSIRKATWSVPFPSPRAHAAAQSDDAADGLGFDAILAATLVKTSNPSGGDALFLVLYKIDLLAMSAHASRTSVRPRALPLPLDDGAVLAGVSRLRRRKDRVLPTVTVARIVPFQPEECTENS